MQEDKEDLSMEPRDLKQKNNRESIKLIMKSLIKRQESVNITADSNNLSS
jgi:hypothetical protein